MSGGGSHMMSQSTPPLPTDLQTAGQNHSMPEGCIQLRFGELEYLPWNNSENIVSREVAAYTSILRANVLQILFLIGGPGNVINMAVFFQQSLKDRVNLLLFSLSLADELCLIAGMFNYVEDFYMQFTGGPKPGPLYAFFFNNHLAVFHSFCFVSFVLSAIIACERCYCVTTPLRYLTLMRTRTMAVVIIAVYMVAPGLYMLVTFKYSIACVYNPDTGVLSKRFSHSEFYLRHTDLIDYTDNIIFGAGLPTVVVIVVVTATVITAWKLRQTVAWRAETAAAVSPREVALTKMLIGTSVLLIVCVSPGGLLRVAGLFLPEMNAGRRHENFYLACVRLSLLCVYINSTFNVFIYFAMGTRYRETFWALFRRKGASGQHKQKH